MLEPIKFPKQYFAAIYGSDGRRSRTYIDNQKARIETYSNSAIPTIKSNEVPGKIIISRADLGKTLSIDCNAGFALEIKLPADFEPINPADNMKWEIAEDCICEGKKCRIYNLYNFGENQIREKVFIDLETMFWIKAETYDKYGNNALTSNWRDVKIGPQSDSVFELPKGLKVKKI